MPSTHVHSKKILRIPYTNASVRETISCPPVSSIIKTRQLHFFSHVACSYSSKDHHQAISASLQLQTDWRRPRRCPHITWLRGIDAAVQSANTSIHSAWRKTNNRVLWRRIDTATYLWNDLHITLRYTISLEPLPALLGLAG